MPIKGALTRMANRLELKPESPLTSAGRHGPDSINIDAVFRRYARYVAAIGLSLLGDDEETDDLIQEVFLEAVRGIACICESPKPSAGGCTTIAVRLARQSCAVGGSFDTCPDVEEVVREHHRRIRATLSRASSSGAGLRCADDLPVEQRIAWTLRHLEGERLDAVARLCRCSLATAKRRIASAHEHLQKVVSDG
jgi:RNA polymerase sigma-70 factor (ECF subfamily)